MINDATANGVHRDSTANANHGTQNNNDDVSAKIAEGQDFEGNVQAEYIEIPNSASMENVQEGDYTVEVWFYSDVTPPGTPPAWNSTYGIVGKEGWNLGLEMTYLGQFQMDHWLASGPTNEYALSGVKYNTTWYHVVGVVSKTVGYTKIYVNGVNESTNSFAAGAAAREYGTTPWRFGTFYTGQVDFAGWANGKIDEVRISSVARDACWIGTEYNTVQYAGDTNYITPGSEIGFAPTEVKLTSFKATRYPEGTLLEWLRMDSREALLKGTKFGAVVVPGSSVSSTLYRLVSGQADPSIRMPHGQAALPDADVAAIAAWIDQGAN